MLSGRRVTILSSFASSRARADSDVGKRSDQTSGKPFDFGKRSRVDLEYTSRRWDIWNLRRKARCSGTSVTGLVTLRFATV